MNTELQHFAYALTTICVSRCAWCELYRTAGPGVSWQARSEADKYIEYSVDGSAAHGSPDEGAAGLLGVERAGRPSESLRLQRGLDKAVRNLDAAVSSSGSVVTSDPLPTLLAQEGMFIQLFQNLVANSIKYKGREIPRIHVSPRIWEEPGVLDPR